MVNTELINFIKQARKAGFSDMQIRKALEDKKWPYHLINQGFESLQPKFKLKNQICIFLNKEILQSLEKRSKKNMMTLSEQIEDILRRSSIRKKTSIGQEKLDDLLISCFSRRKKK